MGFHVVIPARLHSTRLPKKILRELAGKPLLQHVWESVKTCGARETVVAVDDAEVLRVCQGFGATAVMTSAQHPSGSDRVNEVARQRGWPADAVVVNVQGDEPLMPPALVRQAAALLAEDTAADLATLCHAIHAAEEWNDPNVVKVAMDARKRALYFSRAPIPFARASPGSPPTGLAFRHIGLYAWRVGALARFSALPPSANERCESLEQLRALDAGMTVKLGVVEQTPPRGVDTEADLEAVRALLHSR